MRRAAIDVRSAPTWSVDGTEFLRERNYLSRPNVGPLEPVVLLAVRNDDCLQCEASIKAWYQTKASSRIRLLALDGAECNVCTGLKPPLRREDVWGVRNSEEFVFRTGITSVPFAVGLIGGFVEAVVRGVPDARAIDEAEALLGGARRAAPFVFLGQDVVWLTPK